MSAEHLLYTCRQCGHTTDMPGDTWQVITPLHSIAGRVVVCSPRCAVVWLEATYRPVGLGVGL